MPESFENSFSWRLQERENLQIFSAVGREVVIAELSYSQWAKWIGRRYWLDLGRIPSFKVLMDLYRVTGREQKLKAKFEEMVQESEDEQHMGAGALLRKIHETLRGGGDGGGVGTAGSV